MDFISRLSKITDLDLKQNNIFELVHIWEGWDKAKQTQFMAKYGHMAMLLKIPIDEQLV